MFPELNLISEEISEPIVFDGKAFLFDYKEGDFVYLNGSPIQLEGKEALKAWIEKVLRTERFHFNVHEDIDYGVLIEDLIGGTFPKEFAESEIEREVTEALLKNPYILSISDWGFEYEGSIMKISFAVDSNEEKFNYSVVI